MAAIRRREWQNATGKGTAWVVSYTAQDGRRHSKSFARQAEAKQWLLTTMHEVRRGVHRADRSVPTLAAAAEAWIRRGTVEGLERSTLEQRRQHVQHMLSVINGGTKLATIDVDAFRDELLRVLSRALAAKVLVSFRSILKQAKMAHLAADMPKIVTGGRHQRRVEVGRDVPAPIEVNAMLKGSTGYVRALLAVAIFCGLRMSEARALRWADVDLEGRQLHVRQRADKWGVIGELKTATSYRSIPMAPFVVNTLREWRLACPRGALDLVLPNGLGRVESLPNIRTRHLGPLQVAAEIVDQDGRAKYGAHSLRHFFASWMIEQGFNVKRISVMLGHSSPVVTLTIYSHLMPAEDDHAKFAAAEIALLR